MKKWLSENTPYIGLVLLLIVMLLSVIITKELSVTLGERLSILQLVFSFFAFLAIIITLIITIRTFRKSMAKPLIKATFNEKGEQSFTLTYKDNGVTNSLPSLWLINEGNAISRYFQIDFIIPENIWRSSIGKYLTSPYISYVKDNKNYKLSYTNEGRYTLFVNTPRQDPNMVFSAAVDTSKCIEFYKDSFKVKYNIYGDWAETQTGELKVKIYKQ